VELIVDEAEWKPKPDTLVSVRTRYLQWTKKAVMQAKGVRWDKGKQVWRMRYETALELGLTGKIIEG
jgi:hypothetical protein